MTNVRRWVAGGPLLTPAGVLVTWLGLAPLPALGQSVVRGRVVSDSGRSPIAGAEIVVTAPSRVARSDAAGRFVLSDLPAATVTLRVRAVGFKPLELEAEIGPKDTVDVEFSLTPAPQRLPTLEVRVKAMVPLSSKMEEFERRKRMGFGTFMTRAKLIEWRDQPLSNAVRQIANIQLVARPFECGGGFAAATGRGGVLLFPCGGRGSPIRFPPACYLAIYQDGALVWAPSIPEDPPPDIDQYRVDQMQAAEVYLGPGQLPAELQQTGTACGALVLWTRTGDPDPPRTPPPDGG